MLEGVSETDQAGRPDGSRENSIVMSAAAPDPRPGLVPGQQGHQHQGGGQLVGGQLRAARLGDAEAPLIQDTAWTVLGEVQHVT